VQRLFLHPQQLIEDVVLLTEDQRHYLRRVLRLRPGNTFLALDGHGQSWYALLQEDGQALLVEALPIAIKPTEELQLITALPKQGFEEVVRQATELGVSRIQPVLSDRTLLMPGEGRQERWLRVLQEAAEQSERLWLPELAEPQDLGEAFAETQANCRLICVLRRADEEAVPSLLGYLLEQPSVWSIALAIGPEGGWTDSEVELAIQLGWHPVSLGTTVLRAVTAPLAALAIARSIQLLREATDP
jgi:16S rRNA (uracil1498-N3)-methyltransferase